MSVVERAFRSLKTVDLKVRPIYHYAGARVRAHVFLCMLAYYVEWHMRQRLKPLLFDDEEPQAAEAARPSIVAPAEVSPSAQDKARRKRTASGERVHSFRTLLDDLATVANNRVVAPLADAMPPRQHVDPLSPVSTAAMPQIRQSNTITLRATSPAASAS